MNLVNSTNFKVKAQSKNMPAQIDILGDIGADWFGDNTSITMQHINDALQQITNSGNKEIVVRIASLGGDVEQALAIHDLLRMSTAKVNVEIIGLTASSGTIIAMAGDSVSISDNALFLIHNASTIAMGTAEDLRNMATMLDTVDSRIVNIYEKKTGKPADEIKALMALDKWITPQEAQDFGLVDNVFEPVSMAAHSMSADLAKAINKSGLFPHISDEMFLTLSKQSNKKMTNEKKRTVRKDGEVGVLDRIKQFFAEAKEEFENETIENRTDKISDEVKTEIAEIKNLISEVNTENEMLRGEKDKLEAQVMDLQEQLAKTSAKKGKISTAKTEETDLDHTAVNTKKDGWGKMTAQFQKVIPNIKKVTE